MNSKQLDGSDPRPCGNASSNDTRSGQDRRSLRILYHHRTRSKDGQAVHIDSLVSALRSLGHEVRVVGPRGTDSAPFGSDGGAGAIVKRWLPSVLYELLELTYVLVCFGRLWRAYRSFRPDVLYERYNLFLLAGAWLRRIIDIPLILEVNAPLARERRQFGNLRLTRLAVWAERYAWRSADHILPVSHVLADELRNADVDSRRISVVPNGVPRALLHASASGLEIRRQLGLEHQVVLGFSGFVRSWHGLDSVIDLIADSGPDSIWHLLLLGDGPALPDLRRRAADRGIAGRVTFAGLVNPSRVPEHLAAIDIALQPAVVPYASPLKIFEYMALGKAIVAPDTPNIREILANGETALLFNPTQPGALRQCVELLTHDPALRQSIGKRAHRQLVERDLTWEGNASRVVELASIEPVRRELLRAPPRSRVRSTGLARRPTEPGGGPLQLQPTSDESA